MRRGSGTVTFINLRKVQEDMRRMPGKVNAATKKETLELTAKIYERSQVYVPVDTGRLKASGRIEHHERGPGSFVFSVKYGGPGMKYAIYVHEDPTKKHAPPTSMKYLERAVVEVAGSDLDNFQKRIGRSIEDSWRGR